MIIEAILMDGNHDYIGNPYKMCVRPGGRSTQVRSARAAGPLARLARNAGAASICVRTSQTYRTLMNLI